MNIRKALRASFVITVSAAASQACSGRVVAQAEDGGPIAVGDSGVDSGTDSGQDTCPSTTPQGGTPCNTSKTCTYNKSACGIEDFAECKGGVWSVAHATCNPPAPTCPATMPSAGTACQTIGSPCIYYPGGNSCPAAYATCTGGKWDLAIPSCNPPIPIDAGPIPQPPDASLDPCPVTPPKAGDPCNPGFYSCAYDIDPACPGTDVFATCPGSTKTWQLISSTCTK